MSSCELFLGFVNTHIHIIWIVHLHFISSRVNVWSDLVRHIGWLFKYLRAWFILHTLFGIFFTSVTDIKSIYGCIIVCIVKMVLLWCCLVTSTTLCCIAWCTCIVLSKKVRQQYSFVRRKLCPLVVCRILTRILSHRSPF